MMAAKPTPETYPAQYLAPFKALPWQPPPWRDKGKLILLSGSAGGGKTRLAAEKMHGFCLKYPNAMALMCRKTRESMTNSTVLFMERQVHGGDTVVRHYPSKNRFEYANGSILAYGGMKDEVQREQIRSMGLDAGLDLVWLEEATHFTEHDFNEIVTRMRGKASPWTQVILSTNPEGPKHWINQRMILGGEANIYYSGALDNPYNPPEYLEWLDKLTGVQRLRLVEGKWVQAEGAVYPDFDPQWNVTDDADFQDGLSVWWGVDDGYAYGDGPGHENYHPRVVLVGQVTAQGGVNIFREYYKCGVSDFQDTIQDVRDYGYPNPDWALVDSSAAQFRGALAVAGIRTKAASHRVSEGIKNVRRLICDGQNVRLLQIHPRCKNLIDELQSYSYDNASKVANVGERKPKKLDDHGPDALRYLCEPLRARSRA